MSNKFIIDYINSDRSALNSGYQFAKVVNMVALKQENGKEVIKVTYKLINSSVSNQFIFYPNLDNPLNCSIRSASRNELLNLLLVSLIITSYAEALEAQSL